MAIRTQGSATAYIVSLVLFGILFVFSLILAVIFKTQVSGAQLQALDATTALRRYVKPDERNRPEILELKARQASKEVSKRVSIVGQLLAENIRLKQLISNSPKSTVQVIKQDMVDAKVSSGQTLIGEVRRLYVERIGDQELIEQHQAEILSFTRRLKAIEQQKMVEAQAYEKTVVDLKRTLTSLQGDSVTYRGQVDTQRQTLEKQLDTARAQTHTTINELRSTIEQQELQIAAQKKRLDELLVGYITGKGGTGYDPTREYDGVITSILSEERLVYIDRGHSDQILLGMTFEVFDEDQGVVVNETGDLRGKATVEVIRTSDRSSLCRVVRLARTKTVNQDDLIANIIYDPNISYRFFVFGDFDIDRTGQMTSTDRRRVETMVTQWGGKLINRLSYNTDFLVLGEEPELPPPLPPNVFDDFRIEQNAAQKKKFQDYQNLIVEAKALSIPILNQNRFLALVGYYRR